MKEVYSAFIKNTNEKIHPYTICIPELDILTEGDDLPDAIMMARDAIGITGITMEDMGKEIPKHLSESDAVDLMKDYDFDLFTGSQMALVDIDFDEYRRSVDMKTVRKNVTIPNWLNVEAEKQNVNVSQVLRDALIKILGVENKFSALTS